MSFAFKPKRGGSHRGGGGNFRGHGGPRGKIFGRFWLFFGYFWPRFRKVVGGTDTSSFLNTVNRFKPENNATMDPLYLEP